MVLKATTAKVKERNLMTNDKSKKRKTGKEKTLTSNVKCDKTTRSDTNLQFWL